MSRFDRQLHQTATYWAPLDTDLFGKKTYEAPVQLTVRWEDKQELYHNKHGQQVVSKSRIFLSQNVDLDGYILLGTSVETDPVLVTGAEEIQQIARIPDLRNLTTMYMAIL